MTTFSIGADPELFVVESKTNKGVSAHNMIPGSKKEPFPVNDGAIQPDGLSAEFNITPANINDFHKFNANIISVTRQLRERIPAGHKLVISPTMDFDPEYLKTLPDSALELGCDPDFNAYTGLPNPIPDGTRAFRTGSGHIHIGWGADIPTDNPQHISICCNTVKALDLYVGLYMTLIDRDLRRRELYGKAGAFRPKGYGVEYRTPSNMWLISKATRYSVWALVNVAINMLRNARGYVEVIYNNLNRNLALPPEQELTEERVRNAIDTGDYDFAYNFFNRLYQLEADVRRTYIPSSTRLIRTSVLSSLEDAKKYYAKKEG